MGGCAHLSATLAIRLSSPTPRSHVHKLTKTRTHTYMSTQARAHAHAHAHAHTHTHTHTGVAASGGHCQVPDATTRRSAPAVSLLVPRGGRGGDRQGLQKAPPPPPPPPPLQVCMDERLDISSWQISRAPCLTNHSTLDFFILYDAIRVVANIKCLASCFLV